MNRFSKNTLLIACVLGAITIILGAFGAHALKQQLSPDQLSVYSTGVTYQFYHVIALLIVGLLSIQIPVIDLRWPVVLFTMGIVLFSGSLYLLSTGALHSIPTGFLGPITPVGGLFFVVGWLVLAIKLLRFEIQKT